MTHQERALQTAAECQQLARALAPYQNRGDLSIIDAPAIPPSPLLKEMNERINVIRGEYGLPASRVGAMLTVDQITLIVSALLNAGNLLEHEHKPQPQQVQA